MNSEINGPAINAAIGRVNAMTAFCIYLAGSLPTATAQKVASKIQESIPQIDALANGSAAPDSHNEAMLSLLRSLSQALVRPDAEENP